MKILGRLFIAYLCLATATWVFYYAKLSIARHQFVSGDEVERRWQKAIDDRAEMLADAIERVFGQ